MATVANGAVRFLSAYDLLDLYMYDIFQKSWCKRTPWSRKRGENYYIWINIFAAAAILDFFQSAVVWFVRHMVMLKSF